MMEMRFPWHVGPLMSQSWPDTDRRNVSQLAYGLGTARGKWGDQASAPLDKEVVELGKTAIQVGFRHLDGAEGTRKATHSSSSM